MHTYEKSLDLVRSSGLSHLKRSPAHFKAWVETIEEDTADMAFGRAFHCYLLEPENFDARYIVRPDFGDMRYKDNKAAYAAWKAEAGDREEVVGFDAIQAMARAVHAHSRGSRLVRGGFAEQNIRVPRGSLTQVIQPDYVQASKGIILDVKKTSHGALAQEVERSVANWGYLMQATHYLSVMREHAGGEWRFLLMFVEDTAPHGIFIGELAPDDLAWCEEQRVSLIDLQQRCVETDTWPCYDEAIQRIKLPVWARR